MSTSTPAPETHAALDVTGTIEVDNSDEWSDSGFGSDTESLVSVATSISQHVYKNGRRYAGGRDARYPLPNDSAECDRHDLLHHIYGLLFDGKLIFSPFKGDPKRILDVGTGTGIWAIDVADSHPGSEVIGTDLSPIQPSWVPPNIQFQIDNAEAEWTFKRNSFDLIHLQNLNGSIADWPKLISQIYDHLEPGGYIEVKEADVVATSDDDSIPAECHIRQWESECIKACKMIGLEPGIQRKLKKFLEDAGFVDIKEHVFKLPVNPWPKKPELKQIGRFQLLQYLDALQAYALGFLVEVLGWSREKMEVFLIELRKDLKSSKIHAYNKVHVFTARKPGNPA